LLLDFVMVEVISFFAWNCEGLMVLILKKMVTMKSHNQYRKN
jgi:hypothetical protein